MALINISLLSVENHFGRRDLFAFRRCVFIYRTEIDLNLINFKKKVLFWKNEMPGLEKTKV